MNPPFSPLFVIWITINPHKLSHTKFIHLVASIHITHITVLERNFKFNSTHSKPQKHTNESHCQKNIKIISKVQQPLDISDNNTKNVTQFRVWDDRQRWKSNDVIMCTVSVVCQKIFGNARATNVNDFVRFLCRKWRKNNAKFIVVFLAKVN